MILTIAMVVYNEEKNISRIERNLALVKSWSDAIRVLIIDNNSTDKTTEILAELQPRFGFELIQRDFNHMGLARAQAVLWTRTDWIVFLDADCELSTEWFKNTSQILPNAPHEVSAVGGPWLPVGPHAELFEHMFQSFWGHFNMPQIHQKGEFRVVRHIPTACVVYRRQDILEVGNFNESRARVGEDLDISYRLRSLGRQLRFFSSLKFEHELPSNLAAWFKKIFLYGEARLHMAIKYKDLSSPTYFLPLVYFIFLCTNVIWWPFLKALPLALYVASIFISTFKFSKPYQSLKVLVYIVATHLAYSLGMVWGGGLFIYSKFLSSKPVVPMPYKPQSAEEIL